MTDLSRRTLLLGGAAIAGTAAVGGGELALAARRHPSPTPMPVPSHSASVPSHSASVPPAPSATPVPAATGSELGTAMLPDAGRPAPMTSVGALATAGVSQDVVSVPAVGACFITQKTSGSNGAERPFESTVVNRVRVADGALLDAMVLVDGGHGLGFEVEPDRNGAWIWITWHGPSADGAQREQDFVRLRYTPGTFTRQQADQQLGLAVVAFQDRTPEAVYHFDWHRDVAVERHWNPPAAGEASTETFIRRRISDLRVGRDDRLDEIVLRATPPTTQGFATLNGTFFRWLGAGTSNGTQNVSDPIVLEQYGWHSGQLIAAASYGDLWQPWEDGVCEPQGLSVQREADGSGSLVLGWTTGAIGRHRYKVSRLASIGTS